MSEPFPDYVEGGRLAVKSAVPEQYGFAILRVDGKLYDRQPRILRSGLRSCVAGALDFVEEPGGVTAVQCPERLKLGLPLLM